MPEPRRRKLMQNQNSAGGQGLRAWFRNRVGERWY
jgi:hypothetical protein